MKARGNSSFFYKGGTIMKRPNGEGSIVKLSGKRRKPFCVRITTGYNPEDGKQIRKIIGTYKSQQDARHALNDYLINPHNLNLKNLTYNEIFKKWSNLKYSKLSHSSILGYNMAFNLTVNLHQLKFADIKTSHLQTVLNKCDKGHASKRKIKYLYGQLYAFAMQNDIINKDYSKYIDIGKNTKSTNRIPFTTKEINLLWKVEKDISFVDTILILIYSGFRIGELLDLKISNIDLENKTMIGGSKTEAGKNRLVPIHHKILPLIKKLYNKENKFLIINSKDKQMNYNNYYKEKFIPIMNQLNMKHRPHDCRHTFATLLNNAEANSTSIKKLIGHSNFITTEKVYTHKDIDTLRKDIELIK